MSLHLTNLTNEQRNYNNKYYICDGQSNRHLVSINVSVVSYLHTFNGLEGRGERNLYDFSITYSCTALMNTRATVLCTVIHIIAIS